MSVLGNITVDALLVFTKDDLEDCLAAGNSAAWRLNLAKAQKMKYLILVRNRPGNPGHGHAFLVAKISSIIPRIDNDDAGDGRFAVVFSEAASVDVAAVWDGGQMPVRYVSAEDTLQRDPEKIAFKAVAQQPELQWSYSRRVERERRQKARSLTIAEAKDGLAAHFGCAPSAIEIIVRL